MKEARSLQPDRQQGHKDDELVGRSAVAGNDIFDFFFFFNFFCQIQDLSENAVFLEIAFFVN